MTKLSFSHIVELLPCDDPTKRAFYELEWIRGNWSVRELKRQIASLYYERAGLSTDPANLAARAHAGTATLLTRDASFNSRTTRTIMAIDHESVPRPES